MKQIWVSSMTEEDAADFVSLFKSSTRLRKRLGEILAKMEENLERKGLSEDEYQNTNWVFLQAFNNGRLATLRDVLALLKD